MRQIDQIFCYSCLNLLSFVVFMILSETEKNRDQTGLSNILCTNKLCCLFCVPLLGGNDVYYFLVYIIVQGHLKAATAHGLHFSEELCLSV